MNTALKVHSPEPTTGKQQSMHQPYIQTSIQSCQAILAMGSTVLGKSTQVCVIPRCAKIEVNTNENGKTHLVLVEF